MTINHAREAAVDVEIACKRDGTVLGLRGHAYVDMGAYMRTNGAVGARNIAQFMSGPYRIPNIDIDVSLFVTNKTPVGTYRGPGPLRDRFLPRTAVRHGGARSRHRSGRVPPSQSRPRIRDALQGRHHHAVREQGRTRQRRLFRHARSLPRRNRLGREGEAQGQAHRRPLSRSRRLLLHRGRRRGTEGERAARARNRRHT